MEYYENPDPEYDNYEYEEDDGESATTGSGDYGSYYDYEYDVNGVDYDDEYGYGNQVISGLGPCLDWISKSSRKSF